jgi:hypothetical protein
LRLEYAAALVEKDERPNREDTEKSGEILQKVGELRSSGYFQLGQPLGGGLKRLLCLAECEA